MKRIVGFSLFLAVFIAIYGAMNYYVYLNIVGAFVLSSGLYLPIQVTIVVLALAYPAAQIIKARRPLPPLTYVGALWMGVLSIAIAIFALKDALSLVLPLQLQTGAAATVLVLAPWAAYKAWREPKLKTIRIGHGKRSQPLNIVHLSDIHLGTMTSAKWLKRVIEQVNSLDADLVVITGDLVEDSFAVVEEFVPLLGSLRAKHGVFAVSGNHEFYQGIEHFHKFCQAAGITVVDGEFIQVTDGVNLVGLDGQVTTAGKGFDAQLGQLLSAAQPGDYNVLLIHHPVGFGKAAKLGVDLQLSGHTHRGQILPFNLFVPLVYRYAYGLHALGDSHIYTSSGTGTWGPPLRLGSKSEIVRIEVS